MQKLHKEIILGFVVVLLGAFSWYFLKYVFYIGNLTLGCWALGIGIFILWGIALCLAMLLIRNKAILYGSFILTLILFGMFFNNEPFYYLVGLIILFWAFAVGSAKVRREESVQVNLNFWRIWKRGLPIFITVLILMIALVYYFSPSLDKVRKAELRIPRNSFNLAIKPFERLIKERLPEGINDLDVQAEEILTKEQIKELEDKYEIDIKEEDTVKDFLYKLANYQLNSIKGPYQKFVPIGLAIALFLGLKLISILYVAIIIMLSWLVLKILIALKFIRIEIETKEVETVKL